MRALEWLFVLSFIPILLMPLISQTWRYRWLILCAPMPALIGGLHLIVEGWRIQMIPLYILAVLVLMNRLPALLGRESIVRHTHGILVSIINLILIIFSGLLAGWLLPVVTLPQLTGDYPVGIINRELVDQTRGRRLMVSIWYPAEEGGIPAPLTHYPDEVATAMGNLSGLPEIVLQHLRYFMLSASEDAPIASDNTPFPVLVFSHGMVGLRLQNSSTLQELASRGYVVVAIDHTDAAAVTVFPDGEARFYDLARFGIPADVEPDEALMNEHVLPVWIADQRFVYDKLESWAVNDPLLSGRLDLTRIGSFGHSFGGATSLEVCRIDTRCRAAVNLDGGLYGDTVTQPALRPLLLMSSADSSQYPDTVESWTHMIENANAAAYWLELPDSTHFSFTITQLLSPLLVPENFDPRIGLRTIDKYLSAFFDTHLRGIKTLPLRPSSETTDVNWFTN